VLRAGGLVTFPTETVYGLGGVATDSAAVARIFAAKGRPATNPIIVHVAEIAAARELVLDWPRAAQLLAERFWPGPLTLVLPRSAGLSDLVTAGGSTVALRVPAHPVALALMRAVRLPIAAPSANRSQRLSPTTAEHVLKQLAGRIELVLDAGPTPGGLESTVLDLSEGRPCLLRPGLVPLAELETWLGERILVGKHGADDEVARSPGLQLRHYAPDVPLTLCESESPRVVERKCQTEPLVGWLALGSAEELVRSNVRTLAMPADPANYAARLYAALHDLEEARVTSIVVDMPPDLPAWQAIRDRLRRAATGESLGTRD
jgi:L-threonylcarbamoyladenylate synthase